MKHLRECLSEPTGKRWHRIYAGMLLVEKLVERGSHALVIELAHGHHFDLIQKVSLLEHFDSVARGVANPWAQSMVRTKAGELRNALIPVLEKASAEELPQDAGLFIRDTLSTCSPGGMSTSTGSTAASSTATGSASPFGAPLAAVRPASLPQPRPKRVDIGGPASAEDAEALAGLTPRTRLQSELKRLTESGIIDIPPESFTFAVQASHDPESRRALMRHLRGCLSETKKARWQRIYAGLLLLENLMQRGSPEIVTEGHHFNLGKQIWLLQEFDHRPDWRAQNLIRKKARALHDNFVQKIQRADAEEAVERVPEHIGDAFSSLRSWVEAGDLSAPSDSSSRPSSKAPSYDDLDEGPAGRRRVGASMSTGQRTTPTGGESSDDEVAAATASDGSRTADTFFTPMQTPAPARALPRPSHLLSL